MAVRVIRKISSWIFLVCVIISITVLGLFYFGGEGEIIVPNIWNPAQMDTLLVWIYIMFFLCLVGMVLFGISQFANSFRSSPKKALMTLGALCGFILLFFITFTLGDGTPIESLMRSVETQKFNNEFWLKTVDMEIFTIYAMLGVAILAIIWGAVRKTLGK